MRLLSLILLLATAWPAFGATWNSDGSRADVQAIHDDADTLDGDTLTMPTGTFEWTAGVTFTKGITLQGLGTVTTDVNSRATVCGTKIQCSVSGAVITWNTKASNRSRMTGIEFIKGSTYGGLGAVVVNGPNTDSRRMIIDNCVFNQLNQWPIWIDSAVGVAYYNSWFCNFAGLFSVDGAFWNGTQGVSDGGQASWADDHNYGTDQTWIFEDNTFVGEICRSSSSVLIGSSGTKTFTVPAGLTFESSPFVTTAIFWDTTTGKPDTNFAMYGFVTSYSGTTLEFAPFDSVGAGSTKGYWTIAFRQTGSDGQHGCRYMSRYNIYSNAGLQDHGLEADGTRGGMQVVAYKDWVRGNQSSQNWIFLRSGHGLFYSNDIGNFQTATPKISLVNYNSLTDAAWPMGGPDGRNPWHSNGSAAVQTGTFTSSAGDYTARDNTKSWTANQYQNYIIRVTSGISVTSATRSGTTLTVVTGTSHGFSNGDIVSMIGADQHWYNRMFGAITVINTTTFTVVITTTPASPATGTIKVRKGGFYALLHSTGTDGTMNWLASVNGLAHTLQPIVGDTYELNAPSVYVTDQCGMGQSPLLTVPLSEDPPMGWPNQSIYGIYSWENGSAIIDNTASIIAGSLYSSIREDEHFFNDTPYPSLSEYQYPHELREEGGGSEPAGDGPAGTRGQRVTKKIRLRR